MDPLSRLRQQSEQRALQAATGGKNPLSPINSQADELGYLEGFAKNALWSAGPSMVGVAPKENLVRWQMENPGSDFVSGMLGMAGPYGAYAKATTGSTKFAKGVQNWMNKVAPKADMASAPVKTAAAREIVRFAPFEAGRVLAAPVAGPGMENMFGGEYKGAWDVAGSASVDLVLGGAIGGIFGGLGAYGRKHIQRRGVRPGADLNAPLQIQLRQMNQALKEGKIDPEKLDVLQGAKNRIKREIIEESAHEGRYFSEARVNKDLGELFQPKSKTRVRVGKLGSSALFRSDRIAQVMQDLPEDWEAFAKFPRIVQSRRTGDAAKNKRNDETVKKMLGKLKNGDANTRWDWIESESTFVVSKKLTDTDWMVFKTDKPDMFLPEQAAWKTALERHSGATFGREIGALPTQTGSDLWDYGMKLQTELPAVDWRGLASRKGAVLETSKELLAKSGFKPYEGTGEAMRRAGLFVRRYMAPAQLQTTDNPVSNRIRIVLKEMLNHSELKTQRGVLGTPKRTAGNQTGNSFFGVRWEDNGSIAARARKLGESADEWDAVMKTIQSGEGWRAGVGRYGLSERGVQLLRRVEKLDQSLSRSIISAQRAAGVPEKELFQPRENHFMLSRSWKGDWRVPVYNEQGKLVYISGGATKSEAEGIAEAMLSKMQAGGKQWRQGTVFQAGELEDMGLLQKLADRDTDFKTAMQMQRDMLKPLTKAARPGTFQKRQEIGGFQIDYDADDFIRSMITHSRRYRKFEAETAAKSIFKKDIDKLKWDDPEAYQTLMERMEKMFGRPGSISDAINKAFDVPLSGLLGKNSASTIVGTANKLLYRYALGFANIGYAVATLATFVQTAFPMMHMVNSLAMNAPERLAKYTTYQPVFSQNGARMLGSIDTLKIAGQAWKELGNPDSLLWKNLQRAAEEGVSDPRFIDEWVGQTAVNKQRFKGVLEGKEGFSKMLSAVADTLPAMTERHARGHSYVMGHVFYRDIMGVTDGEILHRLATDFTEKTQYMYSSGDRPQLFNGPLGGMFGLFKTWMAHYTGWMMSYMGEAAKYGNWKPLLWMMGGTTAVGGVGALPFIGTADDMSKALSNDGMLLSMYEMQGGADPDGVNWADLMYYGLPSLFGASVQSTVSAPLADPGADIIRMMSFAHLQQAQKMMNAWGPVTDAMEAEGRFFLSDPEARRSMLNALAPKTLVRIAQAAEGDTLRSMNTGNAMVTGMSPLQRASWGLSLNPTAVEKQFEISREMWNDQDKRRERVGYYGQQLANMYDARDMREAKRLFFRASVEGIPLDSIQRSAQARQRRQNTGLLEAQFDDAVAERMRRLGLL
ncbi:hypothetical protein [Idiomarina abyssalis]|uniref:hypothetical protein n=1 Tax=Idiomarina abyssalis TaxID=86102 RepID=UPI003A8CE1EE